MPMTERVLPVSNEPDGDRREEAPAALRPTEPQRRYLERGLSQPGGKLPLFYPDGREVPSRTVQACIANGWAEPWFKNPVKPDWLVCRLTPRGREVLGQTAPAVSPAREAARRSPKPRGRKP
jgi:hypothetical protein